MANPANQPNPKLTDSAPAQRRAGQTWDFSNCAVIVAGPADEMLWAGGLMLLHPQTRWTVITLCRKSDPDRAAKFMRVMQFLGAKGIMGDMNDGPEQKPPFDKEIKKTILSLLPMEKFDLVLTHSRWGEYTRNLLHEETSKAVMALFNTKELMSKLLWMFAYEDGFGKYLPKPSRDADFMVWLPDKIWQEKYRIITEFYALAADSFEAKCCPKQEAFWSLGAK